jgi:hypothetical protein
LRTIAVAAALCLFIQPAVKSEQTPGIRGFTAVHLAAQQERERVFRNVPTPDNLR